MRLQLHVSVTDDNAAILVPLLRLVGCNGGPCAAFTVQRARGAPGLQLFGKRQRGTFRRFTGAFHPSKQISKVLAAEVDPIGRSGQRVGDGTELAGLEIRGTAPREARGFEVV